MGDESTEKAKNPTVGNEDDGLGLGPVSRLRDVRREAADFILPAGGLALVHLATQAAVAHSYILGHFLRLPYA